MKVGDYVRTKTGHIFKITGSDIEFATELKSDGELPFDAKIISQNIIDLIEVGDYVNGEKVKSVPLTKCVNGCKKDTFRIANCIDEDIKSIVTKEQFESVEYKI